MTDNNKHLVRVGHEFAAAMSDDTPIITIAKMVTELASALDVQSARSDALAAELARYSMPAGEADQRMAESRAVRQALGFGQDADDVAPVDLVERINALAAESPELAAENAALKEICEDRRTFIMNGVQLGYIQVPTVETDSALETIRIAVSPQEPTPNTDAWVNEQRAAGADLTKQQIEAAMKSCYQDEQIGLIEAAEIAGSFAAQLRGSQV
ncbi:eae-like domain protein [Atlantibacter hermannii]|uniref:eae-like domain protein n=1 Tax=Atlantibacter hermannii TaxID=565 RepID=UPI0028ABD76E|nr:eae-like domain protein [Atlantibacter hermannii]